MNSDTYHDIVIGAGVNGMVCAASLARVRRRVLVIDAADSVGGAMRAVPFGDGSVPLAAQLQYGLPRTVFTELELHRHGLRHAATDIGATAVDADGRGLDYHLRRATPLPPDAADAARWPAFIQRMVRFADVIEDIAGRGVPRASRADGAAWLKLAWRLRRLGKDDMREFLRIGAINIFDVLEEQFEDPLLKGALAAESLLGHQLAPRSPNSVLTFLARLAGEGDALPVGGLPALADALHAACRARRVDFRLAAPVTQIVVEDDRVTGVALASGEVIRADNVVSSADPGTTCLDLIGARHFDTGLVRRLRHVRGRGHASRVDLLLDDLSGLDRHRLGRRLLYAPDMNRLERAFDQAKYGEMSTEPLVELLLPSVIDPTQCRGNRHLATALVQFTPPGTPGTRVLQHVAPVLERLLPGIGARIVDQRVTTADDVAAATGIAGGHWHHAELALDQYFLLRPLPALSRYRLPVAGGWLCGASMHPGGGVHGLAGHHAAAAILRGADR